MKALFFRKHGDLKVLEYGDLPQPTRGPREVLIKVSAVALNHLDIWVRRGWSGLSLPMPHIGGSDVVGTIVDAPAGFSLPVDTRVMVLPGMSEVQDEWTERGEESVSPHYRVIGEHRAGGLAEFISVPQELVYEAPQTISDHALSASLLTGLTCWRMLFTRGALVAGETVLVVGSGGGVNSLTIQMSARLGCTVIALAGGKQKAERALSLGATYAIDYSTSPEWYREVHRLTNRRGVDLALDNVGEKTMEQSLRSLRWGGRLVTVGNTSGWNVSVDNRLIFAKQLSILGSTMGSRGDFESAQKFLRQHAIEPVIDTVAPLSEGIHQIQRLERGEHFGKIVLLPSA